MRWSHTQVIERSVCSVISWSRCFKSKKNVSTLAEEYWEKEERKRAANDFQILFHFSLLSSVSRKSKCVRIYLSNCGFLHDVNFMWREQCYFTFFLAANKIHIYVWFRFYFCVRYKFFWIGLAATTFSTTTNGFFSLYFVFFFSFILCVFILFFVTFLAKNHRCFIIFADNNIIQFLTLRSKKQVFSHCVYASTQYMCYVRLRYSCLLPFVSFHFFLSIFSSFVLFVGSFFFILSFHIHIACVLCT